MHRAATPSAIIRGTRFITSDAGHWPAEAERVAGIGATEKATGAGLWNPQCRSGGTNRRIPGLNLIPCWRLARISCAQAGFAPSLVLRKCRSNSSFSRCVCLVRQSNRAEANGMFTPPISRYSISLSASAKETPPARNIKSTTTSSATRTTMNSRKSSSVNSRAALSGSTY